MTSALFFIVLGAHNALAEPSVSPPPGSEIELPPAQSVNEPIPEPRPGTEILTPPPGVEPIVKMSITPTENDVRANDAARGAPTTCFNDRWNSCFNGDGAVIVTNPVETEIYGYWDFDIQVTMRTDMSKQPVNVVFWYGNVVTQTPGEGQIRFLPGAVGLNGLGNKTMQEIVAPLKAGAEGTWQRTLTPQLATTFYQEYHLSTLYYANIGGRFSDNGYTNGVEAEQVRLSCFVHESRRQRRFLWQWPVPLRCC
ncbi:hypothetical protein [Rhodococcus erythropolis]|uniref:hypothetical protein n=2 Tax=Rhodococcus erythropolis TaxID=1833 RepID=UPI000370FF16|nr:hypothetical protein [Rhodococcus erythropolis]